jgi:dienelactone hydrolase
MAPAEEMFHPTQRKFDMMDINERRRAMMFLFHKFAPVLILLGGLLLATAHPLAAQTPLSFEYAPNVPLEIQVASRTVRDGMAVEDFSFLAPTGRRVNAYLVAPPGKGPYAGVLYLHWLGDPATSNRTEFLSEALAFAKEGVVCLLIDGLWFDEKAFPWTGRDGIHDRQQCVRAILECRRALDVLLNRPEVDPRRVGLVAHDFGAMAGAQLAGIDSRVRCFVLMAGTPHYHTWFFRWSGLSEAARPGYVAEMSPVDPATLVAKADGARFLFQFSRDRDEWVSRKDAREFYDAAKGAKQIRWYDTDHSMRSAAARDDRLAWLREQLLLPQSSGVSSNRP